jgi:class 3 adenylate cyclase
VPKLSPSERAKLPDSAFAYVDGVGNRRLPINDEAHVRNALARFERVAFEDEAARERARKRLLNAAKKHGIVPVGFITGQLRTERAAAAGAAAGLPSGAVTFLMSDIEGSTKLLERLEDGYPQVLSDVRRIHRRVVRSGGGHEVDARADEYFAVFEDPVRAIDAAIAIHKRLAERSWPGRRKVRVAVGIHHGRPTLTDSGYVGLSVHTVARLCAAANGGQIVVSERVREAAKGALPSGVRLKSLGAYRLHGLSGQHRLFEVQAKGLPVRAAKLRIGKR